LRGVMIVFIGDLECRAPYISVIQRGRQSQPQFVVFSPSGSKSQAVTIS
jgi:hypothetical protein